MFWVKTLLKSEIVCWRCAFASTVSYNFRIRRYKFIKITDKYDSPPTTTPIFLQRSSLLSQSTANHNLPEHSIPAAAHDLYPLILNMVTSHARNASQLSRFWVVHLNKKPAVILPELKACTSFCLMKDLNKLCESLHAPRKFGKKIPSLLFKPGISYSKNSTKLREAVEMLERGANQAHPERSWLEVMKRLRIMCKVNGSESLFSLIALKKYLCYFMFYSI